MCARVCARMIAEVSLAVYVCICMRVYIVPVTSTLCPVQIVKQDKEQSLRSKEKPLGVLLAAAQDTEWGENYKSNSGIPDVSLTVCCVFAIA